MKMYEPVSGWQFTSAYDWRYHKMYVFHTIYIAIFEILAKHRYILHLYWHSFRYITEIWFQAFYTLGKCVYISELYFSMDTGIYSYESYKKCTLCQNLPRTVKPLIYNAP